MYEWPDDPADVGRCPEHIPGGDVVDVAHGPDERNRVAAVVADNAFRLARRPGGVQDIERVGRRDRHRVDGFGRRHHILPVHITGGIQLAALLLALHYDAPARGMRARLDRRVEHRLVLDDPGRFDSARCGHDDGRLGVVDPHGEFIRGEPAEHHRVDGAEAGASEHRDHRLGDHRHIDDHAIALRHPQATQCSGETCCSIK